MNKIVKMEIGNQLSFQMKNGKNYKRTSCNIALKLTKHLGEDIN